MDNIYSIHHLNLNASNDDEYQKTVHFYRDLLGLKVKYIFEKGIMLDTGNGMIEIFHDASSPLPQGTIRHLAFGVKDTIQMLELVRKEGYTIKMEAKDVVLGKLKAKVGFCIGELGEEIEFFQECGLVD